MGNAGSLKSEPRWEAGAYLCQDLYLVPHTMWLSNPRTPLVSCYLLTHKTEHPSPYPTPLFKVPCENQDSCALLTPSKLDPSILAHRVSLSSLGLAHFLTEEAQLPLSPLINIAHFLFLFCLYKPLIMVMFLSDGLDNYTGNLRTLENTGYGSPSEASWSSLSLSASSLEVGAPSCVLIQCRGQAALRVAMGGFTRGGLVPSLCHSYSQAHRREALLNIIQKAVCYD